VGKRLLGWERNNLWKKGCHFILNFECWSPNGVTLKIVQNSTQEGKGMSKSKLTLKALCLGSKNFRFPKS
jgi:hypothetical protein